MEKLKGKKQMRLNSTHLKNTKSFFENCKMNQNCLQQQHLQFNTSLSACGFLIIFYTLQSVTITISGLPALLYITNIKSLFYKSVMAYKTSFSKVKPPLKFAVLCPILITTSAKEDAQVKEVGDTEFRQVGKESR